MSLFDEASLVVTPNGVKEGKLYSIKPTDGSGDLNVVRATSATRVDANGLVEIPRTNLVLRSEEFENVYWNKVNTTVTSNVGVAPDGTTSADRLQINGGGFNFINRGFAGLNTTITTSIWVKANSVSNNTFRLYPDAITGTQFTATNEWQRITVTKSVVNGEVRIAVPSTGAAVDILIWGAQLEQGVSATEYIPTTSVIRTKFAGITQDGSVASNIPRLDYSNGSCPSILVEPQRTNLLLRSEEFDNVEWKILNSASVSANTTTAPNGTLTADTLTFSASAISCIYQTISSPQGSTTLSIYAKVASGTKQFRLRIDSPSGNISDNFTATTEWQRFEFKVSTLGQGVNFYIINADTATSGSLFIWGAQLEQGSNATSYIPTVASAVTRNADVISKTGISDLIGQTEGTLFFDGSVLSNDGTSRQISLSDGSSSTNKLALIYTSTSNQLQAFIRSSGSISFNVSVILTSAINENKIALKYKQNDFALWVNGVQLANSTSGNVPSLLNKLSFDDADGTNTFKGNVKQVQLYKTALTNSELETLTTL